MKNFIIGVGSFLLSLLVGILGVKIILSVSSLYELAFITNLGFLKLYGLLAIIQLVFYKYEKLEEDAELMLKDSYIKLFTKILIYLVFWGLSFVMYNILK